MNNTPQRRSAFRRANLVAPTFAVGERVRIVNAPSSYGYNGRVGLVIGIEGTQINVIVDEHPSDMRCTTFYAEELERESTLSA